ncbi:G-protein coupled receptor 183 [Heterocephalus glaber]|uniref:G-protein coupled receptor 183 n=1 Tax=Heterocephalus glaber TaxID=10181 RepID=A0AAX6PTX7_HETGA|nr:G-protein coupled receptor 183 [Heterocephalus glaber]
MPNCHPGGVNQTQHRIFTSCLPGSAVSELASGMADPDPDPSMAPASGNSCLPYFPPRGASVGLSLFYSALLVSSSLGNILALCLARHKGEKTTSTGVYLTHLAVSDLLFAAVLPGKIAYYARDFRWPLGDALCRLTAFVTYLNTYGGVYLMGCVSADRYLAVVRAPRCARLRSPSLARRACAVAWVLALLQTAPLLLLPLGGRLVGRTTCMELGRAAPVLRRPGLVLAACALGFCVPVGLMFFCYARIAQRLRAAARRSPPGSQGHYPRRAWRLALAVLVVVVGCFSPYHLLVIQFMARALLRPPSCAEQQAFAGALQVTMTLMNLNCAIDPVIYFFASTRYRKWLLGFWKLRASSPPGKASSETASVNQTRGSVSPGFVAEVGV